MDPKSCTAWKMYTASINTHLDYKHSLDDFSTSNERLAPCVSPLCVRSKLCPSRKSLQKTKVEVETHFQSGYSISFGEFPEHQAEISIYQVVYLLCAVDSWDITQLRSDRGVKAHKPRDDTTFPGQQLRSPAATGRLVSGQKRVVTERNPQIIVTLDRTNG